MPFDFPHLFSNGTHYEVGFSMGKTFKTRIEAYFNEFESFRSKILPYLDSLVGKQVYDKFLRNVTEGFPWYVDEIRGIAEGSDLPFEWIFAINLRVELLHLMSPMEDQLVMECSDFHLVDADNFLLLHNEDTTPCVYTTAYLVSLKINSTKYGNRMSPTEEFTCYCYPGHLPGNAFAANKVGFVYGVNALRPKLLCLNRIPRQFVNCALLSARNLQEVEHILLNVPVSHGFSLNLSCSTDDLSILRTDWTETHKTDNTTLSDNTIYPISWNYEVAPNSYDNSKNIVAKHCIVRQETQENISNYSPDFYSFDFYSHFNHYERINIDECNVISSWRRGERMKKLAIPKTEEDLLAIAGDHGDVDYPIYRKPSRTDPGKTVATGLFNMNSNRLTFIFGKPDGDYEFMFTVPLK